jgi:hypothetical protein
MLIILNERMTSVCSKILVSHIAYKKKDILYNFQSFFIIELTKLNMLQFLYIQKNLQQQQNVLAQLM